MNKPFSRAGRTFPMPAVSVNFSNGMIVTAEDLRAAMAYPVALMQSVNRAVYGCGVVCGLWLEPDPDLCRCEKPCDPCKKDSPMAYPSFVVQVGRGAAIDCSGMPLELCEPVKVDLGDRSCGCDATEGEVCLYIRRVSAPDAARGDCCGSGGGTMQCTRSQDHVEIRAFPRDEPPEHACMHPFDNGGDKGGCGCGGGDKEKGKQAHQEPIEPTAAKQEEECEPDKAKDRCGEVCDCLKQCGDCHCCGEGWILLGCLTLCKGGIVKDSFEDPYRHRKWIKTIDCHCRGENVHDTTVEEQEGKEQAPKTEAGDYDGGDAPAYVELWGQKTEPEFERKLHELIGNYRREGTFLAAGANTMERLRYLLEVRQPYLQSAFGLKSPEVLQDYLHRVKEEMKKQRPE